MTVVISPSSIHGCTAVFKWTASYWVDVRSRSKGPAPRCDHTCLVSFCILYFKNDSVLYRCIQYCRAILIYSLIFYIQIHVHVVYEYPCIWERTTCPTIFWSLLKNLIRKITSTSTWGYRIGNKKNNALRYQWNSKDVVHSLFSPCSGVQRPSKAPHCRRWKLSFASKHSMSRSGKVDAEGAGPGESLAEFVLHQWVDPKMRGILWYTVPQKLAYCSPMVKMFETRIIPWYWGYSNFLQVLYDIICCFS
jgi:hypothetical protein